jgi:protoporphyrinogen oxidase
VIIVGGGLAGLSAAYELAKLAEFDIHLIEKDSHLGGRVSGCDINGCSVDTGGFIIYPWYKRYRELIEALGLGADLVEIPPVADYYVTDEHSYDKHYTGFKLAFKDMVEIFIDVFPNQLIDTDPTEPRLDAYDHLSIKDYLDSLNINPEKRDFYLGVFDTYLQGYCYGPVTQYKMAFMAATLFQNILHGDMHSASYLRNGSKVFIDAMQAALQRKGVKIHFNCQLESINKNQMVTSLGTMTADDFIFCHTPAAVSYSKFITATILFSGKVIIDGNSEWGACFYKDDPGQPYSILSIVNLEKLYTPKAAQHLNLNIKVNGAEQAPLSNADLLEIIRTELHKRFKDISVVGLVNREEWGKAMPIATEEFVTQTKNIQGQDHLYYAGDFMGCPSMETALMSGKRAAEQLIYDIAHVYRDSESQVQVGEGLDLLPSTVPHTGNQ